MVHVISLVMWPYQSYLEGKDLLFFFWLWCVACSNLSSWPGIKPVPPAVEEWSPNHWDPPGNSLEGLLFETWSTFDGGLQITHAPSFSHYTEQECFIVLITNGSHTATLKEKSLAAAAKSLQSCPTLCDPIDGSPPGSPVPGILQARTLEWVAISFSNAWKWKVKVKSLSRVRPSATPWTAAYQAPPSMGFSRQEYWSEVPLPSPKKKKPWDKANVEEQEKSKEAERNWVLNDTNELLNHTILRTNNPSQENS